MATGYVIRDGVIYTYTHCQMEDLDALEKHLEKELLRLKSEQPDYNWTSRILPGDGWFDEVSGEHIPY